MMVIFFICIPILNMIFWHMIRSKLFLFLIRSFIHSFVCSVGLFIALFSFTNRHREFIPLCVMQKFGTHCWRCTHSVDIRNELNRRQNLTETITAVLFGVWIMRRLQILLTQHFFCVPSRPKVDGINGSSRIRFIIVRTYDENKNSIMAIDWIRVKSQFWNSFYLTANEPLQTCVNYCLQLKFSDEI